MAPPNVIGSHGKPKLVVGIDFGTTYSGVSWVIEGANRKVWTINNWPNPLSSIANSEKVPSVISYDGGQVKNWGFKVGPKEEACRWMKILLEKSDSSKIWTKYCQTPQVKHTEELLHRLQKTPEQVVTDFLRCIWTFAKQQIHKREPYWETDYNLQVVLTVPAVWSDSAKHKTMRAAEKASLGRAIIRVSEPEAAALASLHAKGDQGTISAGDTFVVCDAGGGTVDLISYNVISTQPLRVEECVEGDGGLCGSEVINFRFEQYLMTLFGGEEEWCRIKPRARDNLMRVFNNRVKPNFHGDPDDDQTMDFWVPDNQEAGVEDHELLVRGAALKTLFEMVFSDITELVRRQVNTVKSTQREVKAILLVGGFGSSPYLYKELDNSCMAQGIPVIWVEDAISSICRGAAMWGLESSIVDTRVTRKSYGFVFSDVWDANRHDPYLDRYYFDELDGVKRASHQMAWVLRKGCRVGGKGKQVNKTFVLPIQNSTGDGDGLCSHTVCLMYCEERVAPPRHNHTVYELCRVTFKVPEWQVRELGEVCHGNGNRYTKLLYTLRVNIATSGLDFVALLPNGNRVGSTSVSFADGE